MRWRNPSLWRITLNIPLRSGILCMWTYYILKLIPLRCLRTNLVPWTGSPSSVTWREFKSSPSSRDGWRSFYKSYSLRSFIISPILGNSSSRKSTLRELISIMPPFRRSPYITYPLECARYLMNTILVALGSSFPRLWVGLSTLPAKPHRRKRSKDSFVLCHSSYGVAVTLLLN